MRILIIRHGDPNYSIDSLTEKGWREAELLSERLAKEGITDAFVSPLGRARDTARASLEKLGLEAQILDWLRELPAGVDTRPLYEPLNIPYNRSGAPWDVYPQYWRNGAQLFTECDWREHPLYKNTGIPGWYDAVSSRLFAFLEGYGYRRTENGLFEILPGTDENRCIAFFCHMGLGLSLISMLTRVPLPLLWTVFHIPTTSVSAVLMEKHPPFTDAAQARVLQMGDASHLYAAGEHLSSSGLIGPISEGLYAKCSE